MVAASCEEQEGRSRGWGGRRGDKEREQLLPDQFLGGINCHSATQLSAGRTCVALGKQPRKSGLGWKETSSGLNESVKAHLQTLQAQQGVAGYNRLESWVVWVCTRACVRRPNKPCVWWGEQRLGVTPLYVLHIYNPFKCTADQRRTRGPARAQQGTALAALLMPVDTTAWWCHTAAESEGGWEVWSKARGREEEAEERISKTTTGQRWRPFVRRDVHRCPDRRVQARHPFAVPLVPGRWPPPRRHPGTTESSPATSAARLAR